jgi:hypothetical protein
MELVHSGGVVQEQAEVPEWVGHKRGERAAPEPVRVRLENVYVRSAEQLLFMKLVSPVT